MKKIWLWGLISIGAAMWADHDIVRKANWQYKPPADPLAVQQIRIPVNPPPGGVWINPIPTPPPEVPKSEVASCTNSGRDGTKTNPADCTCAMGCDLNDPHGSGIGLGLSMKNRCKTYCRQNDCKCKPACL